ncbi:MAG TPA: class I SAM-dependent methyltransferase [Myxococcota bacterium]|nr:class I SAM-dependent methyltransferase [Myxococcota bacterium]
MSAALTTQGGAACPACGARARARIELDDFRLFGCDACGCWSSDAAARGARTSFEPDAYFANADADLGRWEDLLRRTAAEGAAPRRLLDVGCGRGAFLRFTARREPGSVRAGIEPDAERARDARDADPAATIAVGTVAAALGGLPGPFDLITLWDVFEHLEDPGAALAALGGRLAPGGLLFVQTIHENSVVPRLARALHAATAGRWSGPARRTHEPHHLVFFSRRGLRTLADRAGLRIRAQWFDRLARTRMDGHPALTAATAALLAAEVALGGGLFVNLLLERAPREARPAEPARG